jgi:hypothetical protein
LLPPLAGGAVHQDLRLVEIGDVDLENGPLEVGDRLELVDEDEYRYPAVVEAVKPGSYGFLYRVCFNS